MSKKNTAFVWPPEADGRAAASLGSTVSLTPWDAALQLRKGNDKLLKKATKLASAAQDPPPILGTEAGETLVGTSGADVIDGRGGDDQITGGLGADLILGGDGDDRIAAGRGFGTIDTQRDGDNMIDGGSGDDQVFGGSGSDHLKGGDGNDVIFGGHGGNNLLDGGRGDDRLIGAFRAPNTLEQAGQGGNDVLIGGKGRDIFEYRIAFDPTGGHAGYGRPGIGGGQDLVHDFKSGQDRLDIVFALHTAGGTYRLAELFGIFDSDGNGVLDAADRHVQLKPVSAGGKAKTSIVLDVGAAMLDAGLLQDSQLDLGPHTLTVWGLKQLRPADFVGGNGGNGGSGGVLPPARTITGDDGPNVIAGSSADETIHALGGDDTVTAGLGDDWVFGGDGDDYIDGDGLRYEVLDGRGGDDVIHGGAGHDSIEGGHGNDRIYGEAGDDYLNGGFSGDDILDGGAGDDRLLGGLLALPAGMTGSDRDLMTGGAGRDIFEARLWHDAVGRFKDTPFRAYGGNEDIVTDFTRGEDQIDISVYRRDPGTGPGTWKFMAGFFDLLDTDGNGVLDANDARVSVQQVSLNGAAKASIVLDYGNAVLDSGLITTAELAPGPHTLTLYGVATLDRADFVADRSWSDLWGNNSANTLVGTAAGEWLDGRGGNDVLDPRGGDDLVMGGAGNDIFKMVHTLTSPIGRDFVFDFTRGQDRLTGFGDRPDGQRLGVSLALLDSNADGRIDGQDAAVRVQEERYVKPGAASPFALSLVIDWDVAFGRAEEWSGQNSWTLFKVTSLDGNDFLDSGGSFVV